MRIVRLVALVFALGACGAPTVVPPASRTTSETLVSEPPLEQDSAPGDSEAAGTPELAVAESTPAEPVEPAPELVRRELTQIEGALFGCEVLSASRSALLRYLLPPNHRPEWDESGRLMRLRLGSVRHLQPRLDEIRVITPEGPCEPRLGQAAETQGYDSVQFIHHLIGGCGREVASFAFANCEVPPWLRYRRLVSHIDHLPRRGPLEPMLEALSAPNPDFLQATEHETARERRARLRRRYRRSVVRTEREELLVLDLHRFLEGSHPCENDEDTNVSVHLRRIDGAVPGEWRTLRPRGRLIGAFVDDQGFIIGLDTRLPAPPRYSCVHGAWDCSIKAIERVGDEPSRALVTRDYYFGVNFLTHADQSPMLHYDDCGTSGW